MATDHPRVVPEHLPEGWLPESLVVLGIAKQPEGDCNVWEALFPEYTIVARGDSLREAVEEAAELLEDYWRVCASDGLSFEQARRPIGKLKFAGLLTLAVAGAVADRLQHHARRRPRLLNIPVDGGSPHVAF